MTVAIGNDVRSGVSRADFRLSVAEKALFLSE